TGRALQQFAPRALESDVTQHFERRLAEEGEKLPLQRASGRAGHGGELPHGPAVTDIGMHRIHRAAHRAWLQASRLLSVRRHCPKLVNQNSWLIPGSSMSPRRWRKVHLRG